MTVRITEKNFKLFEIKEEYKQNFVAVKWTELSDFNNFSLRMIGDALRGPKSQHFWCDGCYCWYVDERQSHEQCVWMTRNGNAMFEDLKDHKLYLIQYV